MNAGISAPQAPGSLGQPVGVQEMARYLSELDGWLTDRKNELAVLDREAMARPELTRDVALCMQMWQTIRDRFRRLVETWDNGRVGVRERDTLSSLIWGRLATVAGSQTSGLSLPEACRMLEAMTGQLRAKLDVNAAGERTLSRIGELRKGLERCRDQLSFAPDAAGSARLASYTERLAKIADKRARGGDVEGLLSSLERETALFERDLIVSASLPRPDKTAAPPPRQPLDPEPRQTAEAKPHRVSAPEPQSAPAPDSARIGELATEIHQMRQQAPIEVQEILDIAGRLLVAKDVPVDVIAGLLDVSTTYCAWLERS